MPNGLGLPPQLPAKSKCFISSACLSCTLCQHEFNLKPIACISKYLEAKYLREVMAENVHLEVLNYWRQYQIGNRLLHCSLDMRFAFVKQMLNKSPFT